MALNLNYKAEATASLFHRSHAFVRGLRGPIGTGKSVSCVAEIVRRAIEQEPYEGVRRSRWAAIRNTYPELKSTTIKTWQDWVDEDSAPISFDSPITSHFRLTLGDGTRVECEVLFVALDRPADVKKLKSLDLTGAWINEASELPKAVLDMATGRVGRYPGMMQGGASWSGVIMDTNSPDDDHWWYKLAEEQRPHGFEFFAQPGALIEANGSYFPNPAAENVQNHVLGYEYWLRQAPGKGKEWINVYLLGNYGKVVDGRPVYSEYNDRIHAVEADLLPYPDIPLIIGLDFGLTPAAAICQVSPRGQMRALGEVCGQGMGIRSFLSDALKPYLINTYGGAMEVKVFGDPAGAQRAQTDEKTCFQEVEAAGFDVEPANTNSFVARREAVAWFLTRLIDGEPGMVIDNSCRMIRKGFAGGYHYRRIQVVGEERFTEAPHKNIYSHIHDALQYACLSVGGVQALPLRKDARPEWVKELSVKRSAGFMGR